MSDHPRDVVPLSTATRTWLAISLQSFGGPAGQIAVMQHHLVDEKRWLGQRRFLHALNYCMLLPGPEAQQLAIYTGWLLNGIGGGLIAGTLFVLPGFAAMLALSWAYAVAGGSPVVSGMFAGLAPVVIAIVLHALWRVGTRALTDRITIVIALGSFLALSVLEIAFPVVILAAGLIGWVTLRGPEPLAPSEDHLASPPLIGDHQLHTAPSSTRRTLAVAVITLLVWLVPPVLVSAVLPGSIFSEQGWFFAGTALVTFGGAYAVLSYVAHQAVSVFGWLLPADMVRGLALAETTPGPLILVVQFVAFVGAYRHPGPFEPWTAGVLASVLVVWVTFVPCFGLVFAGAPYVERLRHHRPLSGALQAITAAVVGVIANLAVFFAIHTLITREFTVNWTALAITLAGLVMLFRLRWSPLRVLGFWAIAALVMTLLTG